MTHTTYRSKPTYIQAFQLTKDAALGHFLNESLLPFGVHISGEYHPKNRTVTHVHTTIGRDRAELGDWIIRWPDGRLTTCSDAVFLETFELP
jgi:hypothetical protein